MTPWHVTGAGGMLGEDLLATLSGRDVVPLTWSDLDITAPAAVHSPGGTPAGGRRQRGRLDTAPPHVLSPGPQEWHKAGLAEQPDWRLFLHDAFESIRLTA